MSTQTFKINGMTCSSCVEKISQRLNAIPDVKSVTVNLAEKKADIASDRTVLLKDVQTAISDLTKYSADFYDDPELSAAGTASLLPSEKKSFYVTYKPLIVVFTYIWIFSLAYQLSLQSFSLHHLMNHLMAGFFIGLSFFKFLDLKAFSQAFSNYDPIAKKWKGYGTVYPFIELSLGFLFIADKGLNIANVLTILVLTSTTYGVYKKLQSKTQFQCACLGAGFNLPLSNVTIIENLAMVFMAAYGLLAAF